MKATRTSAISRAIFTAALVMAFAQLGIAKVKINSRGVHPSQPLYEKVGSRLALNCEMDFENLGDGLKLAAFSHTIDNIIVKFHHSTQDFWENVRVLPSNNSTPPVFGQVIPPNSRVIFLWPYTDFSQTPPSLIKVKLTFKSVITNEAQDITFDIKPVLFRSAGKYIFPLRPVDSNLEWVVVQGHGLATGHRRNMVLGNGGTPMFNQRYAHDITLNEKSTGRSYPAFYEGLNNKAPVPFFYYGFGQEVIAAASGVVCKIKNDEPDIPAGANYTGDWPGGNRVIINHQNGEYSVYFHLKEGSVAVKEGQAVKQGQKLGQLGNSGNTSGPHLHFQIQSVCATDSVENLPVSFQNISVRSRIKNFPYVKWLAALSSGDAVHVEPNP